MDAKSRFRGTYSLADGMPRGHRKRAAAQGFRGLRRSVQVASDHAVRQLELSVRGDVMVLFFRTRILRLQPAGSQLGTGRTHNG
jgi:hypothetical protein